MARIGESRKRKNARSRNGACGQTGPSAARPRLAAHSIRVRTISPRMVIAGLAPGVLGSALST